MKITSNISSIPNVLIISIGFILVSGVANAKPDNQKTTLGDLACTDDQVVKWDGNAWVCAEDVDTTNTDWNSLSAVPPDIADGDNNSNAATLCGAGEVLLGDGACQELATAENDTVTALWEQFRPRVIFMTSETYQGNLGGLEGADEKCTFVANDIESIVPGGDYIAILSTSTIDAVSRPKATKGTVVNAKGEFVADNVGALFLPGSQYTIEWNNGFAEFSQSNDRLVNTITYDETGEIVQHDNSSAIWTGTTVYGEKKGTDPAVLCSNWTTSLSEKNGIGIAFSFTRSKDSRWLDGTPTDRACSFPARLYCLSK